MERFWVFRAVRSPPPQNPFRSRRGCFREILDVVGVLSMRMLLCRCAARQTPGFSVLNGSSSGQADADIL